MSTEENSQESSDMKDAFASAKSIKHDELDDLLKKEKIFTIVSVEDMDRTRFAQGYELLYTPDAIINIGGKQYVVEIKSMNTFSYKQNNEHPTGGKQCLLYMYLCNIQSGFVLMEDKNTQDFKIQIVKYDENEVNLIIERLKEIQKLKADFLDTKKPPKRICENAGCKQAESCFMRDCCWNIGAGRIKLNKGENNVKTD